jgi:hypothetical protein
MPSKKRSAAKSPQQPKHVPYFADASLGRSLVERLREQGFQVVGHDEVFDPGTPDTTWIPEVASRGWVILSKDTRIRYTPDELKALDRAGARMFVLIGGNLRSEQMAEAFSEAREAMARQATDEARPFVARVSKDGRITKVHIIDRS